MAHPAQQYYNPELTEDEVRALLRRNHLLLQTSQAALGLISADILALAVEPRPDAVVIHTAVSRNTPELAEDLDDIAFELEAFLAGGPEQSSTVTTRIHLGPPRRHMARRHPRTPIHGQARQRARHRPTGLLSPDFLLANLADHSRYRR